MSERPCFVYVIATLYDDALGAPVKIGIANNPRGRLRELQVGSARKLALVTMLICDSRDIARRVEIAAHENCQDEAMSGEWFDVEVGFAVGSVVAGYLTGNGCGHMFAPPPAAYDAVRQ